MDKEGGKMKVEDGSRKECEHCWCEEVMVPSIGDYSSNQKHSRCCNCGLKKLLTNHNRE
ncbi:hypothetical protein LCGC14_2896160 [marine sediment metagenome]|uniref:Uncharacterized protein n=1 Tax=marine sediment metagenome TaxID=412755 RepID=A0A0F9ALY0_9ZZZZ